MRIEPDKRIRLTVIESESTSFLDYTNMIVNTGNNSVVGKHQNVNVNFDENIMSMLNTKSDLILRKLDLILKKLNKKGSD
ncbi:MAG: hypothetical protein LBU10_01140 [Endomicrobium sp.]|jgi:hypothetical protein|nr:hypothetical protein [Endomicrobium sp.]